MANCTSRTLGFYRDHLQRFAQHEGATLDCDMLFLQRYLTGLRDRMQPVTAHSHFRPLRTFFRWCVETGPLTENPIRSITMRAPKTLPRVPEDDHVRKLLTACPDTFEGRRNRALVALLADSGLRISEALRLRVEDVRFGERTISVHQGKGSKDGVAFLVAETAKLLREWFRVRHDVQPEDFVFADRDGRPFSRSHACHVLHRLSVRAGLPRKVAACPPALLGNFDPPADWRPRTRSSGASS